MASNPFHSHEISLKTYLILGAPNFLDTDKQKNLTSKCSTSTWRDKQTTNQMNGKCTVNGTNRKALRVLLWWDQEQKQWSAEPWVWMRCGDREGRGGCLQLSLLFPLFALIIFCRTACLLVSSIPWPLNSWQSLYSPFNPASPLLGQCPTNHELACGIWAEENLETTCFMTDIQKA